MLLPPLAVPKHWQCCGAAWGGVQPQTQRGIANHSPPWPCSLPAAGGVRITQRHHVPKLGIPALGLQLHMPVQMDSLVRDALGCSVERLTR